MVSVLSSSSSHLLLWAGGMKCHVRHTVRSAYQFGDVESLSDIGVNGPFLPLAVTGRSLAPVKPNEPINLAWQHVSPCACIDVTIAAWGTLGFT
jgi:hypothetical protein